MNLHSLIIALDDYRFTRRCEPTELRLSPIMYAWLRDRLHERQEDYHPLQFQGCLMVMDREIDGFLYAGGTPETPEVRLVRQREAVRRESPDWVGWTLVACVVFAIAYAVTR